MSNYLFMLYVLYVFSYFELDVAIPLFVVKVSPGKKNFSTEQFDEFKTVLETMVTNAENNRVMQHLRYILVDMLFIKIFVPFLNYIYYIFFAHLIFARS